MEERLTQEQLGSIDAKTLASVFRTSKKTIQEYIYEIERHCRYKTMRADTNWDTILDDRSRLIDLYESCLQQDAHLRGTIETLESQIIGERYMLATQTSNGQFIRDIAETEKIQGTQFTKIIKGIAEAKLFGYTLLEITNAVDPKTKRLKEVNQIERRNILPDQNVVLKRQGLWSPRWDITQFPYNRNYILINSGDLGLFAATTPLVLAKKFTFSNFISFAHTYGMPIIHGKTSDDDPTSKQTLADRIANAASQRILVTGVDDEIEVKTITTSNSERIYGAICEMADKDIANLILGSESMAGATQSYVGSTQAHQDIYRDRIMVYRKFVENIMNEEILPRLVEMGHLLPGRVFKYSSQADMGVSDQIRLIEVLSKNYEISPEEIEKKFGINVGRQLNADKVNAVNQATKSFGS